uniref:Uncharacterized protein n=1 Tax=Physcomitrium patens TaxID=3218 RepID=A0A7I4A6H6_PHYPA
MSSVLGVSASCVAGHVAQSRSWVPSVNARISTHRRVFVGGAGVTRSHGWRTLERGVARRSGGTGWGGSNAQTEPLDLTEENVQQVLLDARSEVCHACVALLSCSLSQILPCCCSCLT